MPNEVTNNKLGIARINQQRRAVSVTASTDEQIHFTEVSEKATAYRKYTLHIGQPQHFSFSV